MKVLSFPSASDDLPWTGERFLVGQTGEIEFEHYHRYLFATQFCRGRDVLDIASGEGYGSFLLSQVARRVTGVDIDAASVQHANREYGSDLLTFLEGSCSEIPLPSSSVDVVVSFETIEHIHDQENFLSEVRRVLRDGGLLVVSTPDRDVYTNPAAPNPFHVLELSRSEFSQLLLRHFTNFNIGLQKATSGSVILPSSPVAAETEIFFRTAVSTFEANSTLERAPYLIAIASNSVLPSIHWGILDDPLYLTALHQQCASEQNARQEAAANYRFQIELHDKRLADLRCQIDLRDQHLAVAASEYRCLEQKRDAVERHLNAIETSTSWRFMTKVQRVARYLGLVRNNRNVD